MIPVYPRGWRWPKRREGALAEFGNGMSNEKDESGSGVGEVVGSGLGGCGVTRSGHNRAEVAGADSIKHGLQFAHGTILIRPLADGLLSPLGSLSKVLVNCLLSPHTS